MIISVLSRKPRWHKIEIVTMTTTKDRSWSRLRTRIWISLLAGTISWIETMIYATYFDVIQNQTWCGLLRRLA